MNKSMINSILTFVIGAGVGAVTSIFIVKKHYEEVSKQEIESVKEVYAKKKKWMKLLNWMKILKLLMK